VAIVCYAITSALVLVARFGLNAKPHAFAWACASVLGALLAFLLGLGGLRTDETERPAEKQRVELDQNVF